MSDRVERNWKMANAASPNVTLPPSKAYRDNWLRIFKKKSRRTSNRKSDANPKKISQKALGDLAFKMYGIK